MFPCFSTSSCAGWVQTRNHFFSGLCQWFRGRSWKVPHVRNSPDHHPKHRGFRKPSASLHSLHLRCACVKNLGTPKCLTHMDQWTIEDSCSRSPMKHCMNHLPALAPLTFCPAVATALWFSRYWIDEAAATHPVRVFWKAPRNWWFIMVHHNFPIFSPFKSHSKVIQITIWRPFSPSPSCRPRSTWDCNGRRWDNRRSERSGFTSTEREICKELLFQSTWVI